MFCQKLAFYLIVYTIRYWISRAIRVVNHPAIHRYTLSKDCVLDTDGVQGVQPSFCDGHVDASSLDRLLLPYV